MRGRGPKFPLSSLLLALLLFSLANLPKKRADEIRTRAVASLSPIWNLAGAVSHYLLDRPIGSGHKSPPSLPLHRLELENIKLRAEQEPLAEWLNQEAAYMLWKGERRYHPLPARVLYRDPSSWSSTLWVHVGEEDNQRLQEQRVGKNSPVLIGGSLIGVVDFVGKKQSRVRLLTDSGVSPAVRVCRGATADGRLLLELSSLRAELEKRGDLFASERERESLLKGLELLRERLGGKRAEDLFLAKGELQGSGASLWRSRTPLLKGIGFNLETADAKTSARELRTGRLLHAMAGEGSSPLPLIQEGDLLVTSGLDGVFPAGLFVATVTSVSPLQEGAYAYEIQARPTAKELNHLERVFILPPLSGESE